MAEKEDSKAFAVGHFAFGYLSSKLTAQVTKTKINIPIIFTLSVIPDIDILIPYLEHRGPAHSIIVTSLIFIPIFVVWRLDALPYFITLAQHSLIGDFIAGRRVQLLWPLTSQPYGIELGIKSVANIALEWITFLFSVAILMETNEIKTLLQPHISNLILFIPTFTVLLPTFIAYPLEVPPALLLPHILFLILFLASILIDLKQLIENVKTECEKRDRT